MNNGCQKYNQLKLNFCDHRIADLFENHTFCLDCGDHWYKGKHYNKQQWNNYVKKTEKEGLINARLKR